MKRRKFLTQATLLGAGGALSPVSDVSGTLAGKKADDRAYWISTLTRIIDPVLNALSNGELKKRMPVAGSAAEKRKPYAYLEAFGRMSAGLAPWLELGPDRSAEGKLREHYIDLMHKALAQALDPSSPDYLPFNQGGQSLVDASLVAYSLLRAPVQFTGKLAPDLRKNLIQELKATRTLKPPNNNHLLFSAMVETTLLELGEDWKSEPVQQAISLFKTWYRGDGFYSDGPEFHFDYYNSYIIHPYLVDILRILVKHGQQEQRTYDLILQRAQRFGVCLERLISPEGTFPPIGRSITNRFSTFHLLSLLALQKQLPGQLAPAQVRSGLAAVMKRIFEMPKTFEQSWLRIGLAGYQPDLGETYMNTGSLYGCTLGFIPLGLPATDAFWASPAQDWTAKKIWQGENAPADKALGGLTW